MNRLRRVLRRGAIAAAVLGALLALTLVLFLLPPIVHLLIDASGAPQVLGVEGSVAHGLSDQLVRDLLTGGTFDARLDGDVFLRSSERSHLVDVSRLFRALLACGVVASALLCWLGLRRKSWLFQGLRDGALLLGLGAALVGAAFVGEGEGSHVLRVRRAGQLHGHMSGALRCPGERPVRGRCARSRADRLRPVAVQHDRPRQGL